MIPRSEYPRPQFVRDEWMNLNGPWQFEIDAGDTGEARGLIRKDPLDGSILVPFCPESKLSGVEHLDFMAAVWYRRTFTLPPAARGRRVLLHFGAVDYHCRVWVNEQLVGEHDGGYTSFHMDITDALRESENTLVVCARDNTRSGLQPSGKQSEEYASHGCCYTRTTGIWQTVWLEWVHPSHVAQVRFIPQPENDTVLVQAVVDQGQGCTLAVDTSFEGAPTGSGSIPAEGGTLSLLVPVSGHHLWDVGQPNLYDARVTLRQGDTVLDSLQCYFGLRSVRLDGMRFLLNGRPVFQRLILDQGFYPEGVYTAPTDEALKRDIQLSMAMGFQGARLHQKVFEARFLYHADHLGYLCWGEMGNWGLDHSRDGALAAFLKDWLPALERDISAPSIIGWCPFNETWDVHDRRQRDDVLRMVYRITKALDPTRPCIDTSGNYHVETDIYDVHDYEQNAAFFRARYGTGSKPIYDAFSPDRQHYEGQPVFVSEYGGIGWGINEKDSWSYGEQADGVESFLQRFEALTRVLMENPDHMGLCYTQLTDVEQEKNGLYTYDRQAKLPAASLAAILRRKAACEEE